MLERARTILRENRPLMDHLVDILLEKETIDGDEFRQIVSRYTEIPRKVSGEDQLILLLRSLRKAASVFQGYFIRCPGAAGGASIFGDPILSLCLPINHLRSPLPR